MAAFSRMPRYDIRNDGAGPYAIFYCDVCSREFRSQPDLAKRIARILEKSGLDPHCLKLEMSESLIVEGSDCTSISMARRSAFCALAKASTSRTCGALRPAVSRIEA